MKTPCTILATAIAATLRAAVPVAWTNSPGMPPYPIKPVPHGVPVVFRVTLRGYTEPPVAPGADVRLWYQTNGMGAAWWSAPATVDGDAIAATFGPEQDVGADRVSLFFGAPSNVFASAVLRLTHSPGFAPASLPLPVPVLDFSAVELRNLSALTNGWAFGDSGGPYLPATGGVVSGTVKVEGKAGMSDVNGHAELGRDGVKIVRAGFPFSNVSKVKWPASGNGTFARLEDIPAAPDLSGYATTDEVAAVRAESALVYRLYSGSNVVAEVTNYNSQVHAPELRLMQLNESNEYITVWTETNGLARTLAKANEYTDAAITNRAAPRAWSKVTAGMGFEAPSNTTWLSTGRTVIAGGLEYEKHMTSGGAIWLLESNGMTADFHAQTNNTAFIDLSNADGTPIFRVEKTDSFLVGVHVDRVSIDGSALVCGVNVVAADHPLVRVKASLESGEWAKEEDGIPTSLATVTWSGAIGDWTCRIQNNTGGNTLFAQMEYFQEGGTKIVNSAAMDVSQGILCTDGIHKCRPVYSSAGGGTITWEVVQ